MMDLSSWDEIDAILFRRLLAIEDDLRLHLFQYEELLSELDPSHPDFGRLEQQYHTFVEQLRDLQETRRSIMRSYGLLV